MECPICHIEASEDSVFCNKCGTRFHDFHGQLQYSVTKTLNVQGLEFAKDQVIAGKYRVIDQLGKGGMGIVYKAEDILLKRLIALKFLRPEFLIDQEAKNRFLLEAQAAAAIDHPNICTVFEVNEFQGRTFIAMSYIEGKSLRDKLRAGVLDLKAVFLYGTQIADGLAEAHRKGIIHRDIKLANIMVTENNQVKIMDFGLAKLMEGTEITATTKIMGTVAYMSPEQAKGSAIDKRTDIWSLGIVLYEMLVGHTPFETKRDQAIIYSILNEWPKPLREVNPTIPASLESIVDRCLQKDPDSRYSTADDLARDLKLSCEAVATGAKEKVIAWKVKRPSSKKTTARRVIPVAAAVLLMALGLVLFGPKSKKAPAEKPANNLIIAQPAATIPVAPGLLSVDDVAADGRNLKVDYRGDPAAEKGATGVIFAKRDYDRDKSKRIIAKFVIAAVQGGLPQTDVIEQFEPISRGDYAEVLQEPRGTLILRADPADADIYVDGVLKGRTEVRLILPPKTYRVAAKKNDYVDRIEDINLRAKEIVYKPYKLIAKAPPTPQTGSYSVDSSPQGAQVFVDDKTAAEGMTPLNLSLTPDIKHRVRLVLKDYEEIAREVEVRGGQSKDDSFPLVPLPVELTITSTPADAEVYINDKSSPDGRTPFKNVYPVGPYKVRIHKIGFLDPQDEVTLSPGKPKTLAFELHPIPIVPPPKNTLIVDSIPEKGARILINGRDMGVTPKKVEVAESQIKLQLEKPGYKCDPMTILFTEPEMIKTVTLNKLLKGKLSISSFPLSHIEIDGALQDKPIPPEQQFEVDEGVHNIKFVFANNVEIVKEATVKPNDTSRVFCNESEDAGNPKASYALTNYPKAVISLDGVAPYDSPPSRTLKAALGSHQILYLFKVQGVTFSVNVFDQADRPAQKKIHASCEAVDFAALKPDISNAALGQTDGVVIVVNSAGALGVDLEGIARGDALPGKDLKVQLPAADGLRFGFHPRNAQAGSAAYIWVLRMPQKRAWKLTVQIDLLR